MGSEEVLTGERDFTLLSEDDPPRIIGSVNRNFAGFGREIFTDTGECLWSMLRDFG